MSNRWNNKQISARFDQQTLKGLSHHSAALSSSGQSLEVGCLLCASRPHLVAHLLSGRLTCRSPWQTKANLFELRRLLTSVSLTPRLTSCANRNHYTLLIPTEKCTPLHTETKSDGCQEHFSRDRLKTGWWLDHIFSPSLKAGLFSSHRRALAVTSLSGPVRPAYTRGDRKKYSRSRKTCNPGRRREKKRKKISQDAALVNIADVLVGISAVSCSNATSRLTRSHVAIGRFKTHIWR